MYYINIWHLHTLWNDHHNRSNNYVLPYKVIMILSTIFLLLYITSLRLICFITEGLYFLIPFIYFIQLPTPPLWQLFIRSLYLSVCRIWIYPVVWCKWTYFQKRKTNRFWKQIYSYQRGNMAGRDKLGIWD